MKSHDKNDIALTVNFVDIYSLNFVWRLWNQTKKKKIKNSVYFVRNRKLRALMSLTCFNVHTDGLIPIFVFEKKMCYVKKEKSTFHLMFSLEY
ncbi:unnamed protein product [Rhizophagus irregularis]|nr:unnamed protein product [Rhizophagus irregularis]CAB5352276.1 unnamed protein product [Rhizophagus irregularis]